ncbi:hypothetical protein [Aquimarina litoralis]|uniref:hypothetical protein n=1 Tax=Aquimarina litoralis TaxID=584605 RepID=UPI001C56BDAB|nr:hypothetical protein [Aquimarina litoralis]MBW1299009.1 hypothetical protein [Aquimarina litoralis]
MKNLYLVLLFLCSGLVSFSQETIEDETAKEIWYDIFNFRKLYSNNYIGWKASYIGFTDSDDDFIIPLEISFGQTKAKPHILARKGYKVADAYNISPGFNGLLKIHPGVYLELGLNVPIGIEKLVNLEDQKSHRFLVGLSANQGIKIIPWKNYGIVMGISVFQNVQTSRVYKTNFGFGLELGVNFR